MPTLTFQTHPMCLIRASVLVLFPWIERCRVVHFRDPALGRVFHPLFQALRKVLDG